MPAFENAVVQYYGPHYNARVAHPYSDEIYEPIEAYQQGFNEMGLDYVVATMIEPPRKRNAGDVPEVGLFRNPVYENGRLVRADYETGSLDQFPVVLDHCVANFEGQPTFHNPPASQQAFGLGLPLERTWNPWPIQDMGNRKDLAQRALDNLGVGIPSSAAKRVDTFEAVMGDVAVAYKPLGGANGRGMARFENLYEVRQALSKGDIDPHGLIQPYLDLKQPIPDLLPHDAAAAEQLEALNSTADRQREVRMHVIASRDDSGELQVEAFPTLRVGETGKQFIKGSTYIALDRDSMGPGHPMYDTSVEATKEIARVAEQHSGEQVPHFYGSLDFMYDGERYYIGDANCRGPRVPEQSHAARGSLIAHIGNSAMRQLSKVR